MDNATYGLIGAILGGFAALSTVFLTHHFTRTRERERYERERTSDETKWLREQRQNCYHNSVRYLIRVKSIGAQVHNTEVVKLPQDAPRAWYDDIAEANAWLSSLHYYCGEDQYDAIGETSTEFSNLSNWLIGFRPTGRISGQEFADLLSPDGNLDYQAFVDLMNQIETTISNCARREFQLGPAPPIADLIAELD